MSNKTSQTLNVIEPGVMKLWSYSWIQVGDPARHFDKPRLSENRCQINWHFYFCFGNIDAWCLLNLCCFYSWKTTITKKNNFWIIYQSKVFLSNFNDLHYHQPNDSDQPWSEILLLYAFLLHDVMSSVSSPYLFCLDKSDYQTSNAG